MVQEARDSTLSHIADPLRHLAIPIETLTLDPANARKHDQRNLDAIAGSLKRFGQRFPIVVQRQGMVIRAGNDPANAREQGPARLGQQLPVIIQMRGHDVRADNWRLPLAAIVLNSVTHEVASGV